MVDFTNCQVKPYKIYGGVNGGKLGIVYNGVDYMLKFPSQKKVKWVVMQIVLYLNIYLVVLLKLKD